VVVLVSCPPPVRLTDDALGVHPSATGITALAGTARTVYDIIRRRRIGFSLVFVVGWSSRFTPSSSLLCFVPTNSGRTSCALWLFAGHGCSSRESAHATAVCGHASAGTVCVVVAAVRDSPEKVVRAQLFSPPFSASSPLLAISSSSLARVRVGPRVSSSSPPRLSASVVVGLVVGVRIGV
jgi:hypothetical protein